MWADRMSTLQKKSSRFTVRGAGSPGSFLGGGEEEVRMRRSTSSVHTPLKHL